MANVPDSEVRENDEPVASRNSYATVDDTAGRPSEGDAGDAPAPIMVRKPHTWNESSTRIIQVVGTMYSFIVLGMHDAAIGALIPWLESYYHISYGTISFAFLAPVVGYITSALLNDTLHVHFGLRGVAIFSSGARYIAYVMLFNHPSFAFVVVALVIAGSGNGLSDGAWNAWVGGMDDANELLGVLHGFYGLGGMLSPAIATSLVTKSHCQWYQFYYILATLSLAELVLLTTAFWKSDGAQYRDTHGVAHPNSASDSERPQGEPDETTGLLADAPAQAPIQNKASLSEVLKSKVTWICSIFLIAYVGVEVALGGWITTYMLRVRHASPFASGMAATLFWTGITVGRVVLGFVTPRAFPSVKEAVRAYLILSIISQLAFWLVQNFIVSLIAIFWLGFGLGPLFPAAIVAATGLLDNRLHVSAIGFMAALGAAGATIAPFLVGAIAELAGDVKVMQPVVLACLLLCLGIWSMLPSLIKRRSTV
ncbi:hypothetical protein KEM56_007044 [Ascosphaera pollenicola]|nr:hypothetical protein KEM56_007044 [Ascosphaera pollenicola]